MAPWLHVLVGLAGLAVGGTMFFGRHRIVARHRASGGGTALPSTAWAVLGVTLLVNALLQFGLALIFATD